MMRWGSFDSHSPYTAFYSNCAILYSQEGILGLSYSMLLPTIWSDSHDRYGVLVPCALWFVFSRWLMIIQECFHIPAGHLQAFAEMTIHALSLLLNWAVRLFCSFSQVVGVSYMSSSSALYQRQGLWTHPCRAEILGLWTHPCLFTQCPTEQRSWDSRNLSTIFQKKQIKSLTFWFSFKL